tara:strand:+ start:26 stop:148 length:123 start_codon:yes stop_codon:yes gene_type:complete
MSKCIISTAEEGSLIKEGIEGEKITFFRFGHSLYYIYFNK